MPNKHGSPSAEQAYVISSAQPADSDVVVGLIWVDPDDGKVYVCTSLGPTVFTQISTGSLTASRAVATDGSGLLTVSATTDTELGYVNGVTSAIQTQLDAKSTADKVETLTNKTIDADGTGNSITNIENADIKAAAAIALNKLAAATASRALVSDGSGFVSAATTTATEIGYVNGVTSAIQTQLDAKRKQGKETIWIPAGAMRPTVSNGCAALADVETTAGRPDMTSLDFDASADEHAQFAITFPKSWNAGTVTFQAFWTTTGAVTTGVAWGLQGVAVADNDTIDVAYGTAVVVTDDALGAAEDIMVTAESGAVTIAGSPGDDEIVYFRIFRDVSDANDDMTQDAQLIGVKLYYTTDAGDDT